MRAGTTPAALLIVLCPTALVGGPTLAPAPAGASAAPIAADAPPSIPGPLDGDPWQMNGNRLFYTDGPVGVGTNAPGARSLFEAVNSGNAILGESTSPAQSRYGVLGITRSTIGQGVFGQATAANGINFGVVGSTSSTAGRAVAGVATSLTGVTYGGRFEAASVNGRGVLGRSTAAHGEAFGIVGTVASDQGTAVYGAATAPVGPTYGGWFENASEQGIGVLVRNTHATGVGPAIRGDILSGQQLAYGVEGRVMVLDSGPLSAGVKGYNHGRGPSSGGYGVWGHHAGEGYGVYGVADGASVAAGVRGHSSSEAGSGAGVFGTSAGGSGKGVLGVADAEAGEAFGVYGRSHSTSGRGVFGLSDAQTGAAYGVFGQARSNAGNGVFGWATSSAGAVYGVRGFEASTDPNAFAIYANGSVGASGLKPFRIDHPFEPANKYLYHYASESPEPQNIYNGVATLDGGGTAWVNLPGYFEEINRDFRYQLTCIGGFAPVYIADEIKQNRFRIAGGLPGLRVSWEVKGVRDDLYVRTNGAPVETEKTGPERGRYQHPELYGLPPEMGMMPSASEPVTDSERGRAARE